MSMDQTRMIELRRSWWTSLGMVEMNGKRFGRLTVSEQIGRDKHRNILWSCQCDCGKETIQRTNTLNMGLVKSCGCYRDETLREKMLSNQNPMWVGDAVSLVALHVWVKSRKSKPAFCQRCGEREPQDLANISQEYKRDPDDYEWLCRTCHMIEDGRMDRRNSNGQFIRASIHTS